MNHIAITGTKGKTTVTRIVQHVLMSNGKSVFGEYGIDGPYVDGFPDNPSRSAELYFDHPAKNESDVIISEATSFVLTLDCYRDNPIDIGVFTGFEETEHSELYETSGEYLEAKRNIFHFTAPGGRVFVSKDTEFFDDIIIGHEDKVVSYGFSEGSNVILSNLVHTSGLMTFDLKDLNGDTHTISTVQYGEFNAQNCAAAFLCCQMYGIACEDIIASIKSFPGVKGRSNVYHIVETDSLVVIDYAHTHTSLENQLNFLNENKGIRKIVTIFGCGGNKSKEKRPLMGEVASRLSSYVVLTNDNPREENPREIIKDILTGIEKIDRVSIKLDRREAITTSLSEFTNATILIAGKGNENVMEMGGMGIPMSDLEILDVWAFQNGYTIRGYFDYID